ncbi:GLPGLI family protein [Aquimarina rhabdastrellae]
MIRILIFLIIIGAQSLLAQNFQGTAIYSTSRKLDFKLDSTSVAKGMEEQMRAMLRKQFQKDFKLSFSSKESIYKEEEKLDKPSGNSNFQIMVVDGSSSSILYKNIDEKRYASKKEIYGKTFLVKDKLEKEDWELVNETKNIGNYTCYKAIRKESRTELTITNDGEPKEVEEEITITAWYTPEIPVSNGPENYWGLPGLILEVNDGSQFILCKKIVLNPKEKVTITEPKKGKLVNGKKFEEIMRKKTQEMSERYNNRRNNGENIEIKIGG